MRKKLIILVVIVIIIIGLTSYSYYNFMSYKKISIVNEEKLETNKIFDIPIESLKTYEVMYTYPHKGVNITCTSQVIRLSNKNYAKDIIDKYIDIGSKADLFSDVKKISLDDFDQSFVYYQKNVRNPNDSIPLFNGLIASKENYVILTICPTSCKYKDVVIEVGEWLIEKTS